MTEILWMDEDDLRKTCWLLLSSLAHTREHVQELVERAVADGYRAGYGDAVADRALSVTVTVKEGNAAGVVVH